MGSWLKKILHDGLRKIDLFLINEAGATGFRLLSNSWRTCGEWEQNVRADAVDINDWLSRCQCWWWGGESGGSGGWRGFQGDMVHLICVYRQRHTVRASDQSWVPKTGTADNMVVITQCQGNIEKQTIESHPMCFPLSKIVFFFSSFSDILMLFFTRTQTLSIRHALFRFFLLCRRRATFIHAGPRWLCASRVLAAPRWASPLPVTATSRSFGRELVWALKFLFFLFYFFWGVWADK